MPKTADINLVVSIVKRSNGKAHAGHISDLIRLARRSHRFNEIQCNYGLTDKQQRASDKTDQKACRDRKGDRRRALSARRSERRLNVASIPWRYPARRRSKSILHQRDCALLTFPTRPQRASATLGNGFSLGGIVRLAHKENCTRYVPHPNSPLQHLRKP